MHTHHFADLTHHCLIRLDSPHLPTVIQKGTIWLHSLPFAMQGMPHLDVPHIGTHSHLRTHRDLAIVAMVLWPLRARARRCGETTFPRASTLWRANSWPRQLILRLQPSPNTSRSRDSCHGVVAPARARQEVRRNNLSARIYAVACQQLATPIDTTPTAISVYICGDGCRRTSPSSLIGVALGISLSLPQRLPTGRGSVTTPSMCPPARRF
jgi:hypothetical protein